VRNYWEHVGEHVRNTMGKTKIQDLHPSPKEKKL
jgi:hypothetical protein